MTDAESRAREVALARARSEAMAEAERGSRRKHGIGYADPETGERIDGPYYDGRPYVRATWRVNPWGGEAVTLRHQN